MKITTATPRRLYYLSSPINGTRHRMYVSGFHRNLRRRVTYVTLTDDRDFSAVFANETVACDARRMLKVAMAQPLEVEPCSSSARRGIFYRGV